MFFGGYLKASKKVLPFEKIKSSVVDHQKLSEDISSNLAKLMESIGRPTDLVTRYIEVNGRQFGVLVYLKTLSDHDKISANVVKPLNEFLQGANQGLEVNILRSVLPIADVRETSDLHEAIASLLSGHTLMFIEKCEAVISVFYPGVPKRAVEEPMMEKIVRGPREGFTETLQDNLGIVRRWVKDPNLRVDSKVIGERTKTEVAILYLNDVANPDIVKEVHKRLEHISIDGIIDSGYLSEIITDNRLTIFPLIQSTERPDKVSAAILEGRVAIIVDRTPFALLVPVTSMEFYQITSDFYQNYWVSSALRLLRGLGTLLSVTLPGLYVALASINPEFLPPTIVQVVASLRTHVPLPTIIETLVSLIIFEIFREAIIRVPRGVDTVLGVSGGVLLGMVAIWSGFVTSVTLTIVIITSLASFCTSSVEKEQAWRFTRYFLLIAGSMFGIVGITLAGIIVLTHLASLKSFGVSYLAPWGPPMITEMVDAYYRIPWWASFKRPPTYRPQQEDRLGKTKEEDEA